MFVYRLIRVPFLIASILILTAGGAGFLYRQQSPPSIPTFPIRISPAALHLGTLLESAAYRHELPLVNVSQRTLTVQVDRSCSCTRLEPDRLVLSPGETQRVSLELDLLHGRDQAGNVPLRSFGTQLGLTCQETGQRASVTLSARVQTILTCDPPRLHLTAGVVDEEDSPEQVVAIRPVVPLRWLVVKEASKHLAAKLEPPEKAGDAYRLRVRVRQGTPRGSLDEAVTLELEDATGKPLPEQLVRVTGCVTGYFDCIPRESTLGIRPVGEEVTETVQIQAVTGLQASRVEPVADKGIAVIPGPEPLTFTVRLRVDRPGELGACTSFVVTDVAGRQHHVNHLLSCYGIEGMGRASP